MHGPPLKSLCLVQKGLQISCSKSKLKVRQTLPKNGKNSRMSIGRNLITPIMRLPPATWMTSSSRASHARRLSRHCQPYGISTHPPRRANMGIFLYEQYGHCIGNHYAWHGTSLCRDHSIMVDDG